MVVARTSVMGLIDTNFTDGPLLSCQGMSVRLQAVTSRLVRTDRA